MNLINRINFDYGEDSFENFRRRQYDLIPNFIELCIDFISKQNNNYLNIKGLDFDEKICYKDLYYSELNTLMCSIEDLDDEDKEKLFFKCYIPKLIHDNYFYLNGNFYVPTVYLLDKPIVVKKKSILISTLFNSLTFNFERNVVTFTGVNIPIHLFVLLLVYHDESIGNDFINFFNFVKNNINKKFKLKEESEENIITYFSKNLNCDTNTNSIIKRFDNLMFDEYTQFLYNQCYQMNEINLITVVRKMIDITLNNQNISFVDLKHKRLVFIELLLQPILKKVAIIAGQTARGFKVDQLKMNLFDIIKNFNTFLKSNYLYDTGNLYSCLLQHKVSMLNPASERGPREISSIHESHFSKICPVTVSSQEPGKTVSIVPGTKVDLIGQIL